MSRYAKRRFFILLGLLWLNAPVGIQAQFSYATNADNTLTVTGYFGAGGNVTIPATNNGLTVTEIGYQAFDEYTNLTSVIIPNSVSNIDYQAFYYCANLTNIAIPSSVSSIGQSAFNGCSSLTAITVDPLNSVYKSLDGVLFNNAQTTVIQFPGGKVGGYAIPMGVTNIAGGAFGNSVNLTSVLIPDSVSIVGGGQFTGCSSLTDVTIGNGVTYIGNFAFIYCSKLTRINFGNSVTNIQYQAFAYCSSLTNVTIPGSVTIMRDEVFAYCTNLTSVFFKGNAPAIVWFTYDYGDFYADGNVTVYYLPGSTGWSSDFQYVPTILWNPKIEVSDGDFGVRNNQFGFSITGNANIPIVIQASLNPASGAWLPLKSCKLTNGFFYFNDPYWANYPSRFYQINSP